MSDIPASLNAAQRLVGAWRLLALDHAGPQEQPADGSVAEGLIIYDADGYMSAQIISPAAGERAAAYHAYFGTYSVDEAASAVTHHRIANNNPGAPADVVRKYCFLSDDMLVLLPQGQPDVRLTFRRAGRS